MATGRRRSMTDFYGWWPFGQVFSPSDTCLRFVARNHSALNSAGNNGASRPIFSQRIFGLILNQIVLSAEVLHTPAATWTSDRWAQALHPMNVLNDVNCYCLDSAENAIKSAVVSVEKLSAVRRLETTGQGCSYSLVVVSLLQV